MKAISCNHARVNARDADLRVSVQLVNAGEYSALVTVLKVDPAFTKITVGNLVTAADFPVPCAFADYDNEGFPDVFVGTVTELIAGSLVDSLAGQIVNEICEAVGSQQCDFARADRLMAQLAERRVADTAGGSG